MSDYRWMLVDDFIQSFNDHRARNFKPSWRVCIDESIVRWYGIGGDWINAGLPHYVAIDRKPENGCEIKNAACGESGIMMTLLIVKGVRTNQIPKRRKKNSTMEHRWLSI